MILPGIRFSLIALLVGTLLGCGGQGSNPWSAVPVSGKITYEDGSLIPAKTIRLIFLPQAPPVDSKTVPRQAIGGVNVADGTFGSPTTYKANDGVIAGKFKLIVSATDTDRALSKKVPKEYTAEATTPLELDTANSPFEIKIKKP
jgi:hypothetical protein